MKETQLNGVCLNVAHLLCTQFSFYFTFTFVFVASTEISFVACRRDLRSEVEQKDVNDTMLCVD